MESSEPKWINSILNVIGVNSLSLKHLYIEIFIQFNLEILNIYNNLHYIFPKTSFRICMSRFFKHEYKFLGWIFFKIIGSSLIENNSCFFHSNIIEWKSKFVYFKFKVKVLCFSLKFILARESLSILCTSSRSSWLVCDRHHHLNLVSKALGHIY